MAINPIHASKRQARFDAGLRAGIGHQCDLAPLPHVGIVLRVLEKKGLSGIHVLKGDPKGNLLYPKPPKPHHLVPG